MPDVVPCVQLSNLESWLRTQELLGDKSDAIPNSGASGSPDATDKLANASSPTFGAHGGAAGSPGASAGPSTPKKSPPRPYKSFSSPLLDTKATSGFKANSGSSYHRCTCKPLCRPVTCAHCCSPCSCRCTCCSPCCPPTVRSLTAVVMPP